MSMIGLFRKPQKRFDSRISREGFALSTEYMAKMDRSKKAYHTLKTDFGDYPKRKFYKVSMNDQEYLADAITGTLYAIDGRSMSGSRMFVQIGG